MWVLCRLWRFSILHPAMPFSKQPDLSRRYSDNENYNPDVESGNRWSPGSAKGAAHAQDAHDEGNRGDGFVGAMTHGFGQGWSAEDAFRLGMAAGTAAVMTPGTGLCHRKDIEHYFEMLVPVTGQS